MKENGFRGSVMRTFMWKIGSAQPPESIQAPLDSATSLRHFEKLGIMKTRLVRKLVKT